MIDTAVLISVMVFAGAMLLILGAYYHVKFREGKQRLTDKIQGRGVAASGDVASDRNDNSLKKGGVKKNFLDITNFVGNIAKPKDKEELSGIQKKLASAGYRKRNSPVIFYGAKLILAALIPVSFSLLKIIFIKAIPSIHFMAISISLALIGFYIPNAWLSLMITKRKEKILEGFPDALDMMIVCVEAGMGMDAAISRTGKEMQLSNKEVSEEFNLLSLELRAGKARKDALRNLAKRIDLEEVNSLVSLLIQTDRFGTSIAQALRTHADAMRVKRYQKAEELAAKLPVKLVFPLLLFIFPTLFVVLVGPAAIRIYKALFPVLPN
jgi:tight adherence protein C